MTEYPVFRAGEILDMAVQIEQEGQAFYESCAHASLGPQTREVFEYLIDQEKNHVQVFTRMKQGLEDSPVPESYPGETRRYIESFVKDQVFSGPAQAAQKAAEISDPLEAVALAIGFEQRSIVFYSAMKEAVRSSEGAAIDQVIAEEHDHIRRLLKLLRDLGP
jgi:rubrerythrin